MVNKKPIYRLYG